MNEQSPIPAELLTPEDPDVLLFPQLSSVVSHAMENNSSSVSINDRKMEQITDEYGAILEALTSAFDFGRILLVQSDIVLAKRDVDGITFSYATGPDVPGFTSVRLNGQRSLSSEERRLSDYKFLRDTFTRIDRDLVFVDGDSSPDVQESGIVKKSLLGEGGKVLVAGKAVIVTPDLWFNHRAKQDIAAIKGQGCKVLYLPLVSSVNQLKGKESFVDSHIDGHVSLILDEKERPHLLYAKSYARQEAGTSKAIRSVAQYLGAEDHQVDDSDLPHLAFNLVQMPDGKVVMTSSDESTALQEAVEDIVGSENLFLTEIPITNYPRMSKGSIRCLTNIVPASAVQALNPTPGRPQGVYDGI